MKVNGDQGLSSSKIWQKYALYFKSLRWGWITDDRIVMFGLAMPCNMRWICCIHIQWFFKCFAYAVNLIHCSLCAFMHTSNSSVSIWLTQRQNSVSLTTQINFPPLAEKLQFVNRPSKSVLCKMDHKACGFHMTFIFKESSSNESLSISYYIWSHWFTLSGSSDSLMVSEGGVWCIWPLRASANLSQRSAVRRLIVTDF